MVLSDDWGRHPSSCQHLVGQLMRQRPGLDVLWVNTIGMRRPSLTLADAKRALGRLRRRPAGQSGSAGGAVSGRPTPRVVSPWMYPGFRSGWQRRWNANALVRAALGAVAQDHRPATLLTTLPITADVIEPLRDAGVIDRAVYYAVDDFSQWPGVDGRAMDEMERRQAVRVDAAVCAGEALRDRVTSMLQGGRVPPDEVGLLPHGVDVEAWSLERVAPMRSSSSRDVGRPRFVFWGLIDARMDAGWLRALAAEQPGAEIELVGPAQAVGSVAGIPGVELPGPALYDELPRWAAGADVLVMPYVDAPVTRAMAPLKLLEYLAAGWFDGFKPVVVRNLPATRPWADCCDVVDTAEAFARVCRDRAAAGCPPEQAEARRRRLAGQAWSEKARVLASVLFAEGGLRKDR